MTKRKKWYMYKGGFHEASGHSCFISLISLFLLTCWYFDENSKASHPVLIKSFFWLYNNRENVMCRWSSGWLQTTHKKSVKRIRNMEHARNETCVEVNSHCCDHFTRQISHLVLRTISVLITVGRLNFISTEASFNRLCCISTEVPSAEVPPAEVLSAKLVLPQYHHHHYHHSF